MKKSTIVCFIIIGLFFQNCKNNKTQPANLENNTIETILVKEAVDTVNILPIDTLQTKEKNAKEIIEDVLTTEEVIKPIEKEVEKVTEKVEKTTTKIIKEETAVKDIIEQKVDKTKKQTLPVTEVIVEKVKETVLETKPIEGKIEKEVKNTTEPAVEKVPEKAVLETNNWTVPSMYINMKNPTDPKIDLSIGKNLYNKHCKSCHGAEGYGDGPKADEMNGNLGDFSTEEFQAQNDGALFYKTSFGRDDMPEFTKKMPDDEDRWLIVNYMRTLAE